MTECTVIQLQRQENGTWKDVYPCTRLGLLTREHQLDVGQSLKVELVSSSASAGLYRAALSYRTSDTSNAQAIYSQEFQVAANSDASS